MNRRNFLKRAAAAAGAVSLAAIVGSSRPLEAVEVQPDERNDVPAEPRAVATFQGLYPADLSTQGLNAHTHSHIYDQPRYDHTHVYHSRTRWVYYADHIRCIECGGVVKDRNGGRRPDGHAMGCTVGYRAAWVAPWNISDYVVHFPEGGTL